MQQKASLDFDAVEWDEGNLDHATSHGVSAEKIEQAISNAVEVRRSKHQSDRRRIEARTDEVATSSSSSNCSAADELDRSRQGRPHDHRPRSGHV